MQAAGCTCRGWILRGSSAQSSDRLPEVPMGILEVDLAQRAVLRRLVVGLVHQLPSRRRAQRARVTSRCLAALLRAFARFRRILRSQRRMAMEEALRVMTDLRRCWPRRPFVERST